MSDELELKTILAVCKNNNAAGDVRIEVTPGDGACTDPDSDHEVSPLLSAPQVANANREQHDGAAVNNESENNPRGKQQSLKHELNEVVVWKIKAWMVIPILLFLIALIIGITLIVCTAGHDDEDEKFDRSSFVVECFFRGNFTLANNSLTLHPVTQPDDSENLLEQLKHQLTAVYSSSPALERYFTNVTINDFRTSTAEFELQFIIPSENQQLMRFTLSTEMVKNVLLQHFYDQDPDARDPFYVIPTSLSMEIGPMRRT